MCVCVVEKLGTYCGNSLLENGEECDGGDSMKQCSECVCCREAGHVLW